MRPQRITFGEMRSGGGPTGILAYGGHDLVPAHRRGNRCTTNGEKVTVVPKINRNFQLSNSTWTRKNWRRCHPIRRGFG
jgi:hypothetical protein